MYKFNFEPDLSLLTVVRTGVWSLETVTSYEAALRIELAKLQLCKRPTSFIIDIRSGGPQPQTVANALSSMVASLGPLHADRTAVVTSAGIAKLQAKRVADGNAQVFTAMALARDWVLGNAAAAPPPEIVYDEASDAVPEGPVVHVLGPADLDVTFTPAAALETAKRMSNAATEVIVETATVAAKKRQRSK
jgi:hypothetical protein